MVNRRITFALSMLSLLLGACGGDSSCPPDELATYLDTYEQRINEFVETSQVATFTPERRAEFSLVMMSLWSEWKIVPAPPCATEHKGHVTAAMWNVIEATSELGNIEEIGEEEVRILEPALLKIDAVNAEARRLESLLD